MKFQDTSIHCLKVKKKVVRTHGHTDKPKAICPTNFFKVGGINIFIIWQVMKYREICTKYNQYLKKLYFHM